MKDEVVRTRCTPGEKAQWEEAAKRDGSSLSQWMRRTLNNVSFVEGTPRERVEPVASDNPTSMDQTPLVLAGQASDAKTGAPQDIYVRREFRPDPKPTPTAKKGRRK